MLRPIGAILLTSALFVWPATPASASETYFFKSVSSSWPSSYTAGASAAGVSFRWVANGDKLYVKDTVADGRRAGAWFFAGGVDGICYNTLGSGKTGLCDLKLTEGLSLQVIPVTCDASTAPHSCKSEDDWKLLLPVVITHT